MPHVLVVTALSFVGSNESHCDIGVLFFERISHSIEKKERAVNLYSLV